MLYIDPPRTRARYCAEVYNLLHTNTRPICITGPVLGTLDELRCYTGGTAVYAHSFFVDDTLVSIGQEGLVLSFIDQISIGVNQ